MKTGYFKGWTNLIRCVGGHILKRPQFLRTVDIGQS